MLKGVRIATPSRDSASCCLARICTEARLAHDPPGAHVHMCKVPHIGTSPHVPCAAREISGNYLVSQLEPMERLIQEYFFRGFKYSDIRDLLKNQHGLITSISTIKRTLSYLGLKRKNIQESNLEDIVSAIFQEIYSCGYNLGYRSMWKKLKKNYSLIVKRNTVYRLLQIIDPDGVAERFGNKLHRRLYISPGPNFIWHIDGYDKLKPFGFAIHGCIDGFSRKLIWLEVATTNNDPKVIAHYYLSSLKKYELIPTVIRSDKGTENSLVEVLQISLRSNHEDKLSGEKSFIQGKSVRNQRIESFWGQLRKHTVDFYIQLFKCMSQENIFNGSKLHVKCLQYCFGPLIKADLKTCMELWNEHDIRKQAARNNLAGKPCILYDLPENYNARDFRKEINLNAVQRLIDQVTVKPQLLDPLFKQLVEIIMPDHEVATTPEDAVKLFKVIMQMIEQTGLAA